MPRIGTESPRAGATRTCGNLAATLLVAAAEALAQEDQASRVSQAQFAARTPEPIARRIVVSVPDRRLALVEGDRVVKIYRVAVGAQVSPSPVGEFRIIHRIPRPNYYAPGKVIPPGTANPLGTRWLGLSRRGYGIHGTNQPASIGRRTSHGCIRMRNRDVEDLFARVRVGDVVEVHAERTGELARIFGAAGAPAAVATRSGPVPASQVALAADPAGDR